MPSSQTLGLPKLNTIDLSLVSLRLGAKILTFSSILSGRFWRGALVVVLVTGGKQSQLLVRLTWTRLLDLDWSLTKF